MSPATSCELCGGPGPARPYYEAAGVVQCPDCGLVYYDGGVEPAELYNQEFFKGGEYLDYQADKPVIQRNFRRHVAALRKLAPAGRLLEIGSAYGFFLDVARSHWEVRGYEIAPEGVAHASGVLGLDVRQGDFLEVPDEPESCDLICMWDTIEHLTHPTRFIEKAARWLKPGGALVMTTGDISSFVARRQKARWRLIIPKIHLFYFTPVTLGRAAEQAGLRVRSARHVGYSRSYKAMMHGLFMLNRNKHPLIYHIATLGGAVNFPVYLNLHDIMMLVAQKPTTEVAVAKGQETL